MGPLAAAGAVVLPGEHLGSVESRINAICREVGFPDGDEFKWSPGRRHWMRERLIDEARSEFFGRVLGTVAEGGAAVIVVLVDTSRGFAIPDATSHEMDAVLMLMERLDAYLGSQREDGIVIADRPGGGSSEQSDFLEECLQTVLHGTRFSPMSHVPINVLTTESRLVRMLQVADVVTSCVTSYFAGENAYSPATFGRILPMVRREYDAYGGRGIKVHPDFRYANLYHWLLGDSHFVRFQTGIEFPLTGRPYAAGPDHP